MTTQNLCPGGREIRNWYHLDDGSRCECKPAEPAKPYTRGAMEAGKFAGLVQALMEIRAQARFEQENPTGLHMTCLSIIQKTADKALRALKEE